MGTRYAHPRRTVTGLLRGAAAAILAIALGGVPARAWVLKSITVDGSTSDWTDVKADPMQWAPDGPAAGLPDLDAPVPSTGRDLTGFAWTWDAAYLYFYVSRQASDSNRQRFWYFIDLDEDARIETGEPVVQVAWFGSSRRTDVELWSYRAAAPGGDPMVNSAGKADGYDLPGTVSLVRALESVNGGSANGIEMESRISWANLGVPSGTPVTFHVATSASTNLPSQIHDNMGGPGGGIGRTRISGVRLDPDRIGTVAAGGRAVFAHTLQNLGTNPDRFEFTWTTTGTLVPSNVVVVADLDGDGIYDPGEPALVDTNGNGTPDSGEVVPSGTLALLAVLETPVAAADGQSAATTFRARSAAIPAISDTALDTLTVATPVVTLVKSADRATAAPGDVVAYTLVYTGGGSADAHAVVLTDAIPPATTYVAGSATGPGTTIHFSHDGGATFDSSESAPVTHVRWSRAAVLSPGGTGTAAFQVSVD